MKKDIHPKYAEATITCACGEVIHTRSTKKEIKVGVCSKCHPFFTGTQKYLDTAGRVEKFIKKYAGVKPAKKKIRTRAGEATVPVTAANAAPAPAGVAPEVQAVPAPAEVIAETPASVASPAPAKVAAETPVPEVLPAPEVVQQQDGTAGEAAPPVVP